LPLHWPLYAWMALAASSPARRVDLIVDCRDSTHFIAFSSCRVRFERTPAIDA
jgi:hypothetical protein